MTDAESGWYAVLTLSEVVVGNARSDDDTVQEALRLVRANSHQAAARTIQRQLNEDHVAYLNSDGETVVWSFVRVLEVQRVDETDLGSGTEVFYRLFPRSRYRPDWARVREARAVRRSPPRWTKHDVPIDQVVDFLDAAHLDGQIWKRTIVEEHGGPSLLNLPAAHAMFLEAYSRMFRAFDKPDFPPNETSENFLARWGVMGSPAAVWDFDCYAISLQVRADTDKNTGRVVLGGHSINSITPVEE